MEIRFIAPELRVLDLVTQELLILPLFEDERPPTGAVGLIDYRLAGHLSAGIVSGEIRGNLLEAQVLPGRPKTGFEQILIIGAGARSDFSPQIFSHIVQRMLDGAVELGARRAIVELPGRALELIEPELALELLVELGRDKDRVDTWTLLEPAPAQKRMTGAGQSAPSRRWGVRGE